MATIQSTTGGSIFNNVKFSDCTFRKNSTASTSTTTTLWDSLKDIIGTPASPHAFQRIESIIDQHRTQAAATGTATGTATFDEMDTTTGTAITNSGNGLYSIGSGIGDRINLRSNSSNSYYSYDEYNRTYTINNVDFSFNKEENEERQRLHQRKIKIQDLKRKLVVRVKSRASSYSGVTKNEQVAIDTLRESITEDEFRRYIKYGFVLVDGQEGKTYQVFKNRSHTKVWKNGKVVEEICIHIKDYNIPPTDSVIAFRAMIRTSEEYFRKMGNVYKMERAA